MVNFKNTFNRFIKTTAGRITAVAMAMAIVGGGSAIAYNASVPTVDKESIVSSSIASSTISSEVSSEVSSSVPVTVSSTSDAVNVINDAANKAVSRVSQAGEDAVNKVKEATPKTATAEKKAISWKETVAGHDKDCDITFVQPIVNESEKTIRICYGGHFGEKDPEVTIKNSLGTVLNCTKSDYSFTYSYSDISEISTLYLCSHDQQIKITVQ